MDTIQQLERILTRLENCPFNLVRVELDMFFNTINSNNHFYTVLSDIIKNNDQQLGQKAVSLVDAGETINNSDYADLSFANSAALRAAVGYQICRKLLGEPNTIKCSKNLRTIGEFYAGIQEPGNKSPARHIRVFSQIFLKPLVSYLDDAMELRHRLLLLLSQYKQRCEWFPSIELLQDSANGKDATEYRLKRDFLRYLFDNGIEFSVESEIPTGHGEVDVLPILPDTGPLPIEVKVFDGASRDSKYISDGLSQTAEYARKFNSPEACYLVYNVAENTVVTLPGTSTGPNIVNIQFESLTIYATVANMCINHPASRAKDLTKVVIELP